MVWSRKMSINTRTTSQIHRKNIVNQRKDQSIWPTCHSANTAYLLRGVEGPLVERGAGVATLLLRCRLWTPAVPDGGVQHGRHRQDPPEDVGPQEHRQRRP